MILVDERLSCLIASVLSWALVFINAQAMSVMYVLFIFIDDAKNYTSNIKKAPF
jgi:hypothetical protein